MRYFLILLIVGVVTLALAWSNASATPASPWAVEVPVSAGVVDSLFWRILKATQPVLGELSQQLRDHLRAALERLLILSRAAPVMAFAVSSAVFMGLVVRESSRTALRFSSPTWNYLGKRLAATSAVVMAVLPVWPADAPFWGCVAAALGFCIGVGFYVGNLPVKL